MTAIEAIRELIDARHSIIQIQSDEEQRVLRCLRQLADQLQPGLSLRSWDCLSGVDGEDPDSDSPQHSSDPLAVLERFTAGSGPGFLVMTDLQSYLDQPPMQRALRRAGVALSARRHAVVFIVSSSAAVIPPLLQSTLRGLRFPPPDDDEIGDTVSGVLAEFTDKTLPADWQREVVLSLKGLTLDTIRHVMYRVLSARKLTRSTMLAAIAAARVAETAGSSFLDYVAPTIGLDDIGGAPSLKDWIRKRDGVFTRANAEAGLPIPKGVLLMGVSGCGKSLFAKAIATTWGLPLFRLDISRVYANIDGNPEATFLMVLEDIEALAPAVLWIDEIENGLGMGTDDQQAASHILSAFLTWMQEKPPLVFVAATANRIEALPAEMIRKGRFDQVFFCDLPNDDERSEIFSIHIRNNQGDPAQFDLPPLLLETQEWNAAEIEQLVIAARIDAAADGRLFDGGDIVRHARKMVPLSQTMSEQIEFIRNWAWDRATPASSSAQEIRVEFKADTEEGVD